MGFPETQPAGPTGQPPTADSQSPFDYAHQARQAQFDRSDDSPTDVNNNGALARSQALTTDMAGKNYEASAARRSIIADRQLMDQE